MNNDKLRKIFSVHGENQFIEITVTVWACRCVNTPYRSARGSFVNDPYKIKSNKHHLREISCGVSDFFLDGLQITRDML